MSHDYTIKPDTEKRKWEEGRNTRKERKTFNQTLSLKKTLVFLIQFMAKTGGIRGTKVT